MSASDVRKALDLVRQARDLLRGHGTRNAYKRVASVVHSVEGAARHAELVEQRDRRDCRKDPCDLCKRREKCAGIFVANADGSYTCDSCIPLVPGLFDRLGDSDVEVWEEGSDGWTSNNIKCNTCRRVIEVVVGKGDEE